MNMMIRNIDNIECIAMPSEEDRAMTHVTMHKKFGEDQP